MDSQDKDNYFENTAEKSDESTFPDFHTFKNSASSNDDDDVLFTGQSDRQESKDSNTGELSTFTPDRKLTDLESYQSNLPPLLGPAGPNYNPNSPPEIVKIKIKLEKEVEQIKRDCWISNLNLIKEADMEMDMFPDYGGTLPFGQYLTTKFNIRMIIKEEYYGAYKLDYLVGMIDSIDDKNPNIIFILRDDTDKIEATLYREEIGLRERRFVPGSIMILREAIVYKPIGAKPSIIFCHGNVWKMIDTNKLPFSIILGEYEKFFEKVDALMKELKEN